MSRNKHGRRSGKDTRDFGDPKRVQALLEQIADSPNTKNTGKKPDTTRGKPQAEKVKSKSKAQSQSESQKEPIEAQSQGTNKAQLEQIPPEIKLEVPTPPRAKLEAPAPKPAPKLKRELAENQKLAYIITTGPILSQIHHAFDYATDINAEAIVFALEERIYRPKGKPKADRKSVCRVRVLNFGYDGSPEPKRWRHLVITGEVDLPSQHLSEVPHYPDGTPFLPGAKIKLFYNLEARCGAIIQIATTNEILSPHMPEEMEYVTPDF